MVVLKRKLLANKAIIKRLASAGLFCVANMEKNELVFWLMISKDDQYE